LVVRRVLAPTTVSSALDRNDFLHLFSCLTRILLFIIAADPGAVVVEDLARQCERQRATVTESDVSVSQSLSAVAALAKRYHEQYLFAQLGRRIGRLGQYSAAARRRAAPSQASKKGSRA
jgi:hypothetical protein